MRVLIVEDNAFNAFCLSRLLQTISKQLKIKVVSESSSALNYLSQYEVSLIILDGNLQGSDYLSRSGPALANIIWSNNPQIPIIAWSDSEDMRVAFAEIFKQHNKVFNEGSCWPKAIDCDFILKSLPFLLPHMKLNYLMKK